MIRISVRSFVIFHLPEMPPKRCADPLEVVAARAPAPAAAGHVPDADDTALLALGFQKFQRVEAKGALILLRRN
jgi:hypothetical protein